MMSRQMSTHSSQMVTPGPEIIFFTTVCPLLQKEQCSSGTGALAVVIHGDYRVRRCLGPTRRAGARIGAPNRFGAAPPQVLLIAAASCGTLVLGRSIRRHASPRQTLAPR